MHVIVICPMTLPIETPNRVNRDRSMQHLAASPVLQKKKSEPMSDVVTVVTIAPSDHRNCELAFIVAEFCNRSPETNINALQARESPVAFEGKGVGVFWILLRTGDAGDDRMGVFARFDFSQVRGLVFFLNRESRIMTA
jgi:hypothetical protein